MRPFSHYNAESIDQALALAAAHDGDTAFIAGGTDLLGVLKDEILERAPVALINLKTIPGLDTIETREDDMTLGAVAKLREVASNADIRQYYPLLSAAAYSVATPEILHHTFGSPANSFISLPHGSKSFSLIPGLPIWSRIKRTFGQRRTSSMLLASCRW